MHKYQQYDYWYFLTHKGPNIFSTNFFHPIREILLSFLILKRKELKLGECKEHNLGDVN